MRNFSYKKGTRKRLKHESERLGVRETSEDEKSKGKWARAIRSSREKRAEFEEIERAENQKRD